MPNRFPDPRFLSLALLAAILIWPIATPKAQDAGLEWRPVQAGRSKVELLHKDLFRHARYYRADSDDFSMSYHLARVATDRHPLDSLILLHVRLSPDYHFRGSYGPDRVLEWSGLQDQQVRVGETDTLGANNIRYRIIRFSFDDVSCAAAAADLGHSLGETTSAGTARIAGYGCEDPGIPLTDARLREILESIEIKE